jgi:uncharacterized protein (TIGR02001 family)
MRATLTLAAAATALVGVAHAEPALSGNVAVTSDYTFRGISQSHEGPAIQGSFDYSNGAIYAGVWGSNVDFGAADGSLELDLYGGLKGKLNDAITGDVGVIGYFYPNASDDLAELDYVEVYGKLGVQISDQSRLAGALFVSPEFTGETGTGIYAELSGAFAVSPAFEISGAVGYQEAEDADCPSSDEMGHFDDLRSEVLAHLV